MNKKPSNNVGSWGVVEIASRKSCTPISLILTPSIYISPLNKKIYHKKKNNKPDSHSTNRRRARRVEL
jgi:hypothetical protein